MKRLTQADLAQVAKLAGIFIVWYQDKGQPFEQAELTRREALTLSQAFLQLYSDKPRRDDDPVPAGEE